MAKPSMSNVIGLYKPFLAKLYIFLRQIEFPLDALDVYLPKKGFMIDLGCGVGCLDVYLALDFEERKILGLDINEKRVRLANSAARNIKNLNFRKKDLTSLDSLPLCDAILLIDVLHHVGRKNHYPILANCYASLRKGGMLLVKDIDNSPRWKYCYNYLQDKVMTLNGSLNFTSPKDMVALLKKAGFKVETHKLKTWKLNPIPHRIYLCRK